MEVFKDFYLFLIFFIPGFISLKIYDLIVPTEQRYFSKSLYEIFAYSSLNFAALSWLIYLIVHFKANENHPFWYGVALIFIMLICPAIWPFFLVKLSSCKCIAKLIVHPIKKPWDYIFGKKEPYWIIITLKDGRKIGGKYDNKSFSSSYPAEEQIYLEEVWQLNEDGKFLNAIDGSKGILMSGSDILAIEFLK